MPEAHGEEQQPLDDMLDLLANCRTTKDFQQTVLPQICDFFSATTAVMHYYAGDQDQGLYYEPIYANIDPVYIRKFRDGFSRLDPFPLAAMQQAANGKGFAYLSDQLVDMTEMSKSEFYNEFLKPQGIHHMMIIVIDRGSGPIGFLGFHRDRDADPFSGALCDIANRMGPHLSATADRIRMADMLSLYQLALDTMSYGLMNKGVLILDAKLTMVFANEYARSVLGNRDDFDPERRAFPTRIAAACQQLLSQRDFLSPMSNVNFELSEEEPKVSGYVRANQSDDGSLLLLAFFNSAEFGVLNPIVCREFCLTEREIDVTRCVVEGKTNSEIAEELFISVRTVQNHLRSIYSKCDVHTRTSLSNRVLSIG